MCGCLPAISRCHVIMNLSPRFPDLSSRVRSVAAGLVVAVALGAAGCVAAPHSAVTTTNAVNGFDRFPVVGPVRYQNDYGFSRGGGSRRHQGVDVMATRGQKVVAIESSTITTRVYSSSCGHSLGISDDDGGYYLYCHMNNYAAGVAKGGRVWAGRPVGNVGSYGNAAYAYPHLHVEVHPGGATGAARNPYERLRDAERRTGVITRPPTGWR